MSRCARVHAHARAPIEPHTYPRTHSRLGTLSSTHPALAHPPIPPRLRHTCAPTRVRARTHTYTHTGTKAALQLVTGAASLQASSNRRRPTFPHTAALHNPSLSRTRTLHVKHPRTRTANHHTPRPSARPCLAPHPIRARPVRRRPRIVAIPGRAWQGPTGGSRDGNGVEMRCKMSICNGGI